MPTYNPTDSKYLTVAQTRTNRGTKDVKIILDINTNEFYTLDDDGNFNLIGSGGGTQTLEQVLTAGNSTGDISILSPDGFTTLDVIDGSLVGSAVDTINSTQGGIAIEPNNCELIVVDGINLNSVFLKLETGTITINFLNADLEHQVGVDENTAFTFYRNNTNQILTYTVCDTNQASIGYIDNSLTIDNKLQITKDGYFMKNIPAFDDDADASILATGYLYQTTGNGAPPLNTPGILMIKQ